jgi:peptidoglycan-associated lipoprotein
MKTEGGHPVKTYAIVLCVSLAVLTSGCGKKISSSSGDQSSMAGKTESIKPDQIAGLPADKSSGGMGSSGSQGGPSGPGSSRFDSTTPAGSSGSSGLADGGMGGGVAGSLQDIYFDYDRFTVRADAVQLMESNAKWLRAHKGQSVLIEGHCDERGTQAYNLVLGEKRAKATKHYLEDLGVPGSQLLTTSYGENRPFCNEQSEACYQKNRRAHFSVK